MNQQTCDPKMLDAFLQHDLNESEEQLLTSHLDKCSDCREELESRAAEQSAWREASSLLGGGIVADRSATNTLNNARSPQIDLILRQLAPTDDPQSLGRIGGYEVTGVVGAGGMGVVLKAHDRSLDRIVAIKVMSPHLASSGSARRRFAREAKAAAAVLHPNVIAIHSVASEDANPFLVMPYVRGASLQKRIDLQGPLPLKDTLRIGAQIAAGLAAAHEQGLVHRDIKPANILLEEGVERVTITDFGLARAVDDASMTCSGVIAGTPQYMSPEQARGEPIDARSDLFSLGSVLYAMCAGRSPFRAETTYGVLHRIANDNPAPVCEVNSDVPEWLGHIIERLMARRPEDRFESAAQVAELLEGCLAHVQQPAAIPLPVGVQALAAQAQRRACEIPRPNRLKAIHQRIPPFGKFIAVAASANALFFAGILIVLELDKGTLTIESEVDDVPIRIVQGNDTVEELTVSKSGKSVRFAAGNYDLEIGGQFDELSLDKGAVTLSRGGNGVVRIVRTSEGGTPDSATPKSQPTSFEAPFPGRVRWGEGIYENAFVKKGEFIAELIELDPNYLERLSNQLSAGKQQVEAAQAFVRVSEESLQARRGNMELFESQLKAHEQVKSQIATAVAATIASAKNKIGAQQAELAEHKAVLEQAQAEFAQQKELFDHALISKLKFQEVEQKVTVAGARVTKAEAEVLAAENDLIVQQNEGEAKEKKAQVEVDSVTAQLRKARGEIARAEGELEKAGLDLKKAQKEVVELEIKLTRQARHLMHAPSSGFVTKLCRNEMLKEGDVICLFWPESANDEQARHSLPAHDEPNAGTSSAKTDGATELEGVWHLESATDSDGKPCKSELYDHWTFRGDRLLYEFGTAGHFACNVVVDSKTRTIRFLKDGKDCFSPADYVLTGDQLTIYEHPPQKKVLRRGRAKTPVSLNVQRTVDALVTITVSGTTDGASISASGMGWRVDDAGHILVPSHVVPYCEDGAIELRYANGAVHSATRLKTLGHLALLKSERVVEGPTISIDAIVSLSSGEDVSAILNGTDNVPGSIKYPRVTIVFSELDGVRIDPELRFQNVITTDFIADDTTLSGAPLLTKSGDVAGMLIRLGATQLIAIPIAEIRAVLKQLQEVAQDETF